MSTLENDLITNKRWVDVVFPVSHTPTLSYHYQFEQTPPPLGTRVVASVGSRALTGFIVSYPEHVDIQTKSIDNVVDVEPVMTRELISLMKQCAQMYAVSHGDVLQTMLLKGLSQIAKKKIHSSGQVGKPLNEIEQKMYAHLEKSGHWDYQHFVRNRKNDVHVLKSLQKKGWVQISARPIKNTTKVKEDTYFRLSKVSEKKLGSKQKLIVEILQNHDWAHENVVKQKIDNITASIKALIQKGIVESKKEIRNTTSSALISTAKKVELTSQQKAVLDKINQSVETNQPEELLLHGVTGSGKTEVYLQAAQTCLAKGKNVLALVPEISLTPQFVDRFISRFGDEVALLHSQRTDAERLTEWYRILQGEAKVVVGTRSAIFSPLDNIGLIILDEFHDSSYKQHEGFRYHALDIANMRSQYHQCPVVLGSATPPVDRYHHIQKKMALPERVTGQALPEVEICDVKNEKDFGKKHWIGEKLRQEIENTLLNKKQVLLFLNRRGYSHIVYCYRCGKEVHCPHCDVTLTFHKSKNTARCHYCYYEHDLDDYCPTCHEGKLVHFGLGTQRIEEELRFTFPDANIARLDRDQTYKKNIFPQIMNQMIKGEIDILLGTQMITKGLDLPNIELVGILFADQSLYFPDYRAAETTFQLVTQVVGRSGRGENKGKALIQTLQPNHYAIVYGATQDFQAFYEKEVEFRKAMNFPPYAHLVLFEGVGRVAKELEEMMQWLSSQVQKQNVSNDFQILGPAPAPISKVRDDYRFHILLRDTDKKRLQRLSQWLYQESRNLFEKRKMKLKMDIDPLHFL